MMNISKLTVFPMILASAMCLGMKASAQSQENLVIGTFSRAIDYAPYMVARDQGWFEDVAEQHSRQLDFVEFQSLPAINEAFATQQLDVVFEAEPPAIIGRAAGIDIRIVAPGVSLTQEIVVSSSSDVSQISDLEGATVAVPFGSSSHYGLMTLLERSGLERGDLSVVDMSPQDGEAAFEAGQVQGWAIWPPFVEKQTVAGRGRTLSDAEVFIQSVVVMSGALVDDDPELAQDLVDVVRRAQAWIEQNPEAAMEIVGQTLNMDLQIVEEAWPKHNFQPVLGEAELADIEAKIEFLVTNRFVRGDVQVEELVQLIE